MSHLRLVDICIVTRDLFRGIEPSKITYPVRVIDEVIPQIERKLSKQPNHFSVQLSARSWGSEYLIGMMHRYEHHAKIVYSTSLNTCWRRFVICKELAHLLIDHEAHHFTTDPVSLVTGLVNNLDGLSINADLRMNSEHIAILGAMEIMHPWVLRHQLAKMAPPV